MKNFDNSKVRRQDRLLEGQAAQVILEKGEYGVLSMVESCENSLCGYGIPLNYV